MGPRVYVNDQLMRWNGTGVYECKALAIRACKGPGLRLLRLRWRRVSGFRTWQPGDMWELQYELLSKLLVSPLVTPIAVPYIISYITPFKEFRL